MSFTPRPLTDLNVSLQVAIQPSPCGRHLVRHAQPESPFFYLGDTAWELFHRLDDKEAEMYLRNRQAKGFNSVMVVVLAEHGGLDYPNREGHWPFFPSSESTPDQYLPDLLQPNPAYFDFIDRVVRLAAGLDITISLVPTWGRYVNGGYYEKPILFDTENAKAFGEFLGERYPFHPFVLGGDSVRYWNPETLKYITSPDKDVKDLKVEDTGPVWEAMAQGLISGEDKAKTRMADDAKVAAYKTFITYHSSQVWFNGYAEASATAQFPKADWLSLDCVQTGHWNTPGEPDPTESNGPPPIDHWRGSSPYQAVRKMYNTPRPDGKPRPVIDLEAHYEATHHAFRYDLPLWTADDIRNGAWQSMFAGACGYTYGCNSIWQMHNGESKTHPPIVMPTTAYTNWYLELDLSGAFYAAVLRRFFLSLPDYTTRAPDSSMILSGTNEPTDGSLAEDKLIAGLKAKSWCMIHLPYGGTVTVDLSAALSQGASGYRAWWVDPKTGGKASLDKGAVQKVENETKRDFVSPSEGRIDTDWVLLLETFSITS